MVFLKKAAVAGLILASAACTNPDRFGGAGADGGAGANGAGAGVPVAPICLLYTSPSPRDKRQSRMPSSA